MDGVREAAGAVVIESLACPECGGSLQTTDAGVKCAACDAEYPLVDGVLDFLSPLSHDVERESG